MAFPKGRKKCIARTDGDFHGSYPCAKMAIQGRDYCSWHDPERKEFFERRRAQAHADRQLEKKAREEAYARNEQQGTTRTEAGRG